MPANQDLFLIDASVYVFRAYFSISPELEDNDGNPTNAVYGFTGFLLSLLEQLQPTHMAMAFDESLETSFRNDIYPDYKANREPAPLELKRQFAHCRSIAEALGVDCFSDDQYEADDIIGTLAHRHRQRGLTPHILSSDKDLAQLIQGKETLWDYSRQQRLDSDGIEKKFGVRPDQIADFLALTGDSVDNIPGVPGVGPKSASVLLKHFGSLDQVLERSEEIAFLSVRGARSLAKKIADNSDAARLSRRLTGIELEVPLPEPEPELAWTTPDAATLNELFDFLNFGRLLRQRVDKLAAG